MLKQLFTAVFGSLGPIASANIQNRTSVNLIQPLISGATGGSVAASGNALLDYITMSLGWIQEVAVGMVILWLVFSGIQIMISGNDQAKRNEAKEHMIAAILGLLMLFLLGFILSMLNANFFRQ